MSVFLKRDFPRKISNHCKNNVFAFIRSFNLRLSSLELEHEQAYREEDDDPYDRG